MCIFLLDAWHASNPFYLPSHRYITTTVTTVDHSASWHCKNLLIFPKVDLARPTADWHPHSFGRPLRLPSLPYPPAKQKKGVE